MFENGYDTKEIMDITKEELLELPVLKIKVPIIFWIIWIKFSIILAK